MTDKMIFEAVPNFSCGKEQAIVEQIACSLRSFSGAALLDYSADADHNRAVYTLAGESKPLTAALLEACRTARDLIDLRDHQGTHPRIGACDVLPIIPLQNATMEQAANLARTVGQKIFSELKIPIYLYGEAAEQPKHYNLADCRRGGFEGLSERLAAGDGPDIGSAAHSTAGATAVGARFFLVAYNINLQGAGLDTARQIAKKIRSSSGGLPQLKALGMYLPQQGTAQVSMNLTDYRVTGLKTVFDLVNQLAAASGASIKESELIGLLPQEALKGVTPEYLMIKAWHEGRILENALKTHFNGGLKDGKGCGFAK
ncbi:MAG: glutamate formimidoyltransferase [Clostridia bacterium]|nr:glutamate formimidoyltransferase [Clostridia bacterium]